MLRCTIIFLASVGLVIKTTTSFSQSDITAKTISWQSGTAVEKANRNNIGTGFKIVTKQRNMIDFVTAHGQTMSFSIDSIEGSWADEKIDGKVIYHVRYLKDITGVVILERRDGVVKGWIDFTEANPDGMSLEFTLTSLE